MELNLSNAARYMLATYQNQTQPISSDLEQRILAACETNGPTPLSPAQLEEVLNAAMPQPAEAHAQLLGTVEKCKASSNYHPDCTRPDFLTQMIGLHRIEKENAEVYQNPALHRPIRDPLYAKFVMDNEADVMLIFNARDVDAHGRPLLMKVVARDCVDTASLDLSKYRTERAGFADIQKVPENAAYVEIKDTNETEFTFGDPLLQVSLREGKELSRSVHLNPTNVHTTRYYHTADGRTPALDRPASTAPRIVNGDHLDIQPPAVFPERIRLSMAAQPSFPAGAWLEAPSTHVNLALHVEPGLIFEPGTTAAVTYGNATAELTVPADDAFLLGSRGSSVTIPRSGTTLGALLKQYVNIAVQRPGAADRNVTQARAFTLLYPDPSAIHVAGKTFDPLATRPLATANFSAAGAEASIHPLVDPERDGVGIDLKLGAGFLSADAPTSLKGWKVVVGYRDENNQWNEAAPATVSNDRSLQDVAFHFESNNAPALLAAGRSLEIRLFNQDGIPAERVEIPFRDIPWAGGHPSHA
ncbi:MAG: hypothetical protein H6729_02000 [Deltaproteobacteria bacterium]|nr:hypothetical protein [Deltaproteobacteria bacterium]